MKKLTIIASLAAAGLVGAASAQDFVAAWDFNYTDGFPNGLDVTGDFIDDTSAPATFGDTSATFSWTNQTTSGLSNGADLGSNQLLRPIQLDTMADGFGWLVDANGSPNAELALNLDLSGFTDAELTFAAGSQNGPVTLNVDVGGSVTPITLSAGADALQTVDISALAGLSNAVVNFSFADFTTTDNALMDNIQVTATPVPEPSAFAALAGALALGLAAVRRRRK